MDIIFSKNGVVGHILLNREKALNAISGDMVLQMKNQLEAWAVDDAVKAVIIEGAGERAFCAGGDIRALYESGKENLDKTLGFFQAEYNLNALIHYFPKPYIALIDGIAMGGGVGVSCHGSHVVVTENSTIAMPENTIGFIPDVGTTYILSRAPGYIGEYLAMTGTRMSAADAIYAGFAHSYIPSGKLSELQDKIAQGADVDDTIKALSETPIPGKFHKVRKDVDTIFNAPNAKQALRLLADLTLQGDACAKRKYAAMQTMSPTSLACSLRSVQMARRYDKIEDCLANEYRFALRTLEGSEFYEGIRALIIDKDNKPKWQPATLEEITDTYTDAFFAPLGTREWHYQQYSF